MELPWTGERIAPDIPGEEWLFQLHWVRYSFAATFVHGGHVLDLGCGAGYGSHLLASSDSNASVVGVDISPDAIAYAKGRYQLPNLHYVVGDGLFPPLPGGYFDLIISFEVLEHLENAERLLGLARELLVSDGLFIVSTPNRHIYSKGHSKPWNPYHVQEFSLSEFKTLTQAYFPHVIICGQTHAVGSLIWEDDDWANLALRADLVHDHPLSQASYLLALCSLAKQPPPPPQMWLMEVQSLQETLAMRQRYTERLKLRVEQLSRSVRELKAYRRRVESHWAVRAWRRWQQIDTWLKKRLQ